MQNYKIPKVKKIQKQKRNFFTSEKVEKGKSGHLRQAMQS